MSRSLFSPPFFTPRWTKRFHYQLWRRFCSPNRPVVLFRAPVSAVPSDYRCYDGRLSLSAHFWQRWTLSIFLVSSTILGYSSNLKICQSFCFNEINATCLGLWLVKSSWNILASCSRGAMLSQVNKLYSQTKPQASLIESEGGEDHSIPQSKSRFINRL